MTALDVPPQVDQSLLARARRFFGTDSSVEAINLALSSVPAPPEARTDQPKAHRNASGHRLSFAGAGSGPRDLARNVDYYLGEGFGTT